MKRNLNQSGFTILELMIATVIFAILLLGATTMIVQIGRMYYKGVVNSRTQQTARTIADDIGRVLQFESSPVARAAATRNVSFPDGTVTIDAFCIGSVRYSYIVNAQVNNDVAGYTKGNEQNYVPHALWRDTEPEECTPVDLFNIPDDNNGQEMLGDGMRLISFGAPVTSNNVSSFTVGVLYGDDDELIDFNNSDLAESKCRGSGLGAQWCSRSLLEISVYRRLQQ